MAHRLSFSRSPTKYASPASCRVEVVHIWKHISYPTSRAISQTKCEKGSLQTRRSILFRNWQISWRATVPGQYLWDFFTLPAFWNSFQGAFPPMVSLSFLQAGSSPPDIDGPASAAIWANCWVGDDSSDLPTSPSLSDSSILLSNSLLVEGFPLLALGCLPVLGVPAQNAPLPWS